MKSIKYFQTKIALIKYIFLSSGFCIFLAIVFVLYSNSSDTEIDFEEENNKQKIHLPKNYNLNITKSSFEGFSNDSSRYKILAQDVKKDLSNNYLLNLITGYYSVGDENISLSASSGVIKEDTKSVFLENDVKVLFNDMIFKGNHIKIDLNSKNISSKKTVEAKIINSTVTADSFNSDESEVINFEGNVESTLNIRK